MNQSTTPPAGSFEGKMFLYRQPELLTTADHAGLGLSPVERPFDFVRNTRVLPLVSFEFPVAQRDYPIVFSEQEIPAPLAVLGISDDLNLFVDDSGNWESGRYIPSYVRCYPISFATAPGDQLAVVIDRAAAAVSENPETPFFNGSSMSDAMQARVDFSARYHAEARRTREFGQRLRELDLLQTQQLMHRPRDGEERPIGRYTAVSTEKLTGLDAETVRSLHADGSLSAIYAHIFSLQNWNPLLNRRLERGLSIMPAGHGG